MAASTKLRAGHARYDKPLHVALRHIEDPQAAGVRSADGEIIYRALAAARILVYPPARLSAIGMEEGRSTKEGQ
jgi:hypothetical protein